MGMKKINIDENDYQNFDGFSPSPPNIGGQPPFTSNKSPTQFNDIPDIFGGQPQQGQAEQGQAQPQQPGKPQPQKPQQPQQENGEEYEEEDCYDENGNYRMEGGFLQNRFGLKIAGILFIALVIFIAVQSVLHVKNAKREELEEQLSLNPTGGVYVNAVDGTTTSNGDTASEGVPQVELAYDSTFSTEIMEYTKSINDQGRTYLTVKNDDLGVFDIYIPNYKYAELDSKGYVLVDVEKVGSKVTFLYISSKQEDLKQLLK